MRIKLTVFDIDGTLAPTDECIPETVSKRLRNLEGKGLKITLISGRTASYLAGLARGMGLRKPLVAGENGGVIFDPISLWERRLDSISPEVLTEIKSILFKEFGELWFQPNQTMITAVPKDLARIEELYTLIKHLPQLAEYNLKINKYNDSVEILPRKNSKGKALAVIRDLYKLKKEEVVVFGNTLVDLPMKFEASKFYIIGDYFKSDGINNYRNIEEALNFFEENLF
ncbi:MAG: HAD family phosphatase [Peptococcaceae bacterium]|nr:HAD family phosphatase [Peptococcaceae bacterium]